MVPIKLLKYINEQNKAIAWDILLITIGSFLFVIGASGILAHHEFITGGIYGLALLTSRFFEFLSVGSWYLLFNLPLLYVAWRYFSSRFLFYNAYCIGLTTILLRLIQFEYPIEDQLYAAIASGVICGAGVGIILRSRGSSGGTDIIALYLYRKFNIGVGKFYLAFNCVLFGFLITDYKADVVIASVIVTFASSTMIEQVLVLFNQRKIVYILSEKYEDIVRAITLEMKTGATLISARGAYSGAEKQMVMTITNNLQMKRLEELVFTIDEHALFIAENSFNVIGSSFGKRKIY